MGFVLLGYVLLWTIAYIIILIFSFKFIKSKKIIVFIILLLILYPLRRLILFKTLFFFYSRSPLQEIHETVKSPGSVYWEDNVWPGYDEYGRYWLVHSYLDGINLKVLALNGDDGKIYLYRAKVEDYEKSEKLRPAMNRKQREIDIFRDKAKKIYESSGDNSWLGEPIHKLETEILPFRKRFKDQRKKDVQGIISREEVFQSKYQLPPMNYTVEFNSVKVMWPIEKLLHADKITVTDNKRNEEIAYSRRYMAYAAFITQMSGKAPDFDYKLGKEWIFEFDDEVIFEYANVRSNYEVNRSKFYLNYKRPSFMLKGK